VKKIFADTNIIIDLIVDRKPYSKFAVEIFNLAEQNKIYLFSSSHSIATTHYILKKYVAETQLREILNNLMDYVTIAPVTAEVLKRATKSKMKDFEDAIQLIAAYDAGADCFVTRNIKDFKESEIPVYAPDEVIDRI
jgi:predicted nucleic acid-binding protein